MLSRRTIPNDLVGILFDKDGTLVDYDKTWYPLNLEAARIAGSGDPELQQKILIDCGSDPETGRTLGDSVFAAASTREIAERMISIGSEFETEELTRALDLLYSEGARNSVSICDLSTLMESLRVRGYRLGIASSDNENSISTTVKVHEIDELIDFIAGYDSGHGIKPGPGMVNGFCRKIGCSPSQVIVVGDNRHDIEMGRSAGVGATIGVLSGTGSQETLGNVADYILESVSELPGLLTA